MLSKYSLTSEKVRMGYVIVHLDSLSSSKNTDHDANLKCRIRLARVTLAYAVLNSSHFSNKRTPIKRVKRHRSFK